MRKSNNLIKSLLSTFLILGLSVPVLASADTKPIEQFWDAGPSVKNVGGYTGVLVEERPINSIQGFVMMDAENFANGVYLCRLINGGRVVGTQRMVVSK